MFERIILIGECREEGVIEESLIPQRREIPNNQGADVLDELNVAGASRTLSRATVEANGAWMWK